MAQGDIITPEVVKIIAEVWHEHALNGWAAKEIQSEVAKRVQDKWPGKHKQDWPGLRAVQARLVTIQDEYNSKDFQDLEGPWHLGTLKDNPIPIEAIPNILQVQELRNLLTRGHSVTVRQALWISRLYSVIRDIDLLGRISWEYALQEKTCELANTKFNSSEYDKLLLKPKELLKQFKSNTPVDYSTYKKAFEQVTLGVKYMGPSLPVDHLMIRDNKVYATFLINGTPKQIEMPYSDPKALLEAVKKQKVVKSIKKLKNGITVILFKESIDLAFENKEFNEYSHNLIAGVKNERPHSTTE